MTIYVFINFVNYKLQIQRFRNSTGVAGIELSLQAAKMLTNKFVNAFLVYPNRDYLGFPVIQVNFMKNKYFVRFEKICGTI